MCCIDKIPGHTRILLHLKYHKDVCQLHVSDYREAWMYIYQSLPVVIHVCNTDLSPIDKLTGGCKSGESRCIRKWKERLWDKSKRMGREKKVWGEWEGWDRIRVRREWGGREKIGGGGGGMRRWWGKKERVWRKCKSGERRRVWGEKERVGKENIRV